MTNKQRKILEFIYDSPKSVDEIKEKFKLNDDKLRYLIDNYDDFYTYYDVVADKTIKASIRGIEHIDCHRSNWRRFLIPLIIDFTIAIAALIIAIISLVMQL